MKNTPIPATFWPRYTMRTIDTSRIGTNRYFLVLHLHGILNIGTSILIIFKNPKNIFSLI